MLKIKMAKESKAVLIRNVQAFYQDERGEEIGTIAAEQLLDFMIAEVGPHIYNHAITDARKLMAERLMSVEDELYAMEKQVNI